MKSSLAIRLLFLVAAAYDGLFGAAFLVIPDKIFEWYQVSPPNHFSYIQFPSALLLIFAIMFLAIAINPQRNRNLIPYGMLLKVSYCAIAFTYWIIRDIPAMWKPFAIIDSIFLILFIAAWFTLARQNAETTT